VKFLNPSPKEMTMKFFLALTLSFAFVLQTVSLSSNTRAAPVPSSGSDDPSPTASPTPDAELDDLKREAALAAERQKKAEAEQAEAEARRATLKAETDAFGDASKVSVPTGGVQTDQEGFVEVKMLSLEAARKITQRLTSNLCSANVLIGGSKTGKIETLVIYNDTELGAVVLYRTMLTQLDQFGKEFAMKQQMFQTLDANTDPKTQSGSPKVIAGGASELAAGGSGVMSAIAIPGIATGIVTSIAQLVNLFRTDTSFQNKAVAIPEDMVVSYLISNLNNDTINCSKRPAIYYPHLYPVKLFVDQTNSDLLISLAGIGNGVQTATDNLKKVDARVKLINNIATTIQEKSDSEDALTLKQKTRALLYAQNRCRRGACRQLDADIADLTTKIGEATTAINDATGNNQKGFEKKSKIWLKDLKQFQVQTQFLIDAANQITTKLDTQDEATRMTALAQLLKAEQLASILSDDKTFMLRVSVAANGTTKIKKNIFVDAKVRHSAGANLVYQLFNYNGEVVLGDAMQFYFDYKSATEVKDQVAQGQTQPKAAESAAVTAQISKRQ
jgi:hypothetical protein